MRTRLSVLLAIIVLRSQRFQLLLPQRLEVVTALRSDSALPALVNPSLVQMGPFKTKELSLLVTSAHLDSHARLVYKRNARPIVSATRLFQRRSPTVNFALAAPSRKTQLQDLVQLATALIAQLNNSARQGES